MVQSSIRKSAISRVKQQISLDLESTIVTNPQIFHYRPARMKHLFSKVRSLVGHFMVKSVLTFFYYLEPEHFEPIFERRNLKFLRIEEVLSLPKNRVRKSQISKLQHFRKVRKSNKGKSLRICDLQNLFAEC